MARANEADGTIEIIGWSFVVGGGLRRRYLIRDISDSGEIKLRTLLDMHRTWNLRFAEGMNGSTPQLLGSDAEKDRIGDDYSYRCELLRVDASAYC
jgi:hypothetical protein